MKTNIYFSSIVVSTLLSLFNWVGQPSNQTEHGEDDLPVQEFETMLNRNADSLALLRFYNESNGPNWVYPPNQFSSYETGDGTIVRVPNAGNAWDPNTPIDTWTGVSLNAFGRVERIALWWGVQGDFYCCDAANATGVGINGPLSDALAELTELKELHLAFNGITGEIPTWIDNLPFLEKITLQFNELTGPIPEEIGDLFYLEQLGLHYNFLDGPIPETIGNNTNLEILHLKNNFITGSLPDGICNLFNLYNIDLSDNLISGAFPDCIVNVGSTSRLNGLRFFWFENNQIEALPSNFYTIDYVLANRFTCELNRLTFDDIVPNLVLFQSYSPQDSVFSGEFTFQEGENAVIDLGFDENMTGNIYTWYREGLSYDVINGVNQIEFTNIQEADEGTYYFTVTNPAAPNLTLYGGPVVVNVEINCANITINPPIDLQPGGLPYCIDDPIPPLEVQVNAGENVNWYNVFTGGTPIATATTSFTPPAPGTYYAEAYNETTGCTSNNRTLITLIEYQEPTYTEIEKVCSESQTGYSVTFTTDGDDVTADFGVVSATGVNEYTIAEIPFDQDVQITIFNTSTGCDYIAFVTSLSADFCDQCLNVVIDKPGFLSDYERCANDPDPSLLIVDTPTGIAANWYDAPTGGSLLLEGSNNYETFTPGTYYVEAVDINLGCVSATRTAVTLTENQLPQILNIDKTCNPDGLSYDVSIETDGNYDVTTDIAGVTAISATTYLISNLPFDTDFTIFLQDLTTFCKYQETVTSLSAVDCDVCNGVTINAPVNNGNEAVCIGEDLPSISVSNVSGIEMDWYDAPTGGNLLKEGSIFYDPVTPGTYYVEARDPNGCVSDSRTPISVTENPLPTYTTTSNPICAGDGLTYRFEFRTDVTDLDYIEISSGTVNTIIPGTFQVINIPAGLDVDITITNPSTFCKTSATVNAPICDVCERITVDPPIISSPYEYCTNEAVPTISATVDGGQTVDWYDVATGGVPLLQGDTEFTPIGPGTYYAEARDIANGCLSDSRTMVDVFIYNEPTFAIDGEAVCAEDFSTYEAYFSTDADLVNSDFGEVEKLAGSSYRVYDIPAGQNIQLTITHSTNLCQIIESISAPNCDCADVSVAPPVADQSIYTYCPEDPLPTLSVTVEAGGTADWYTEPTGGILVGIRTLNYRPSQPGIYYAETHLSSGCTSDTRTAIEVTEVDHYFNVITAATCNPDFQTYFVEFETDANQAIVNFGSPTEFEPGKYRVDNIPINEQLSITLRNDQTTCDTEKMVDAPNCDCSNSNVNAPQGEAFVDWCANDPAPTLLVTVDPGLRVDWYDEATGGNLLATDQDSYTPNLPAAGIYYAEAIDQNSGCPSIRTPIEVIEITAPSFNITEAAACDPGNETYHVSISTNADDIIPSSGVAVNLQNGNYRIDNIEKGIDLLVTLVVNGVNCNFEETVASPNCGCFGANVLPPVKIEDVTICEDESGTLQVDIPPGYTVEWYDAPVAGNLLGSEASLTISQEGTYYAAAVDEANGCPSLIRTAVSLTIETLPTYQENFASCPPSSATYTANFDTDADLIVPDVGILNDLGNGTYEVTDIPPGVDLNLSLTFQATGCTRQETIFGVNCDCIEPVFADFEITICEGESFDFDNQALSESGVYEETIPQGTVDGCDSITTLILEVLAPIVTTEPVFICPNEGFETCDGFVTEPGQYECLFTSINGCDSTVIYDIQINNEDNPTIEAVDDDLVFPEPPVDTLINLGINDLFNLDQGHTFEILDAPQFGTAFIDIDGQLSFQNFEEDLLENFDFFSYRICDFNCTGICDTAFVSITYQKDYRSDALALIPNSFTPNGDQFNDFFDPLESFRLACDLNEVSGSLRIVNRWGDTVYFSEEGQAWNGEITGGGPMLTQGTYYYLLKVIIPGDTYMLKGPINLLSPKD